MNLFDIETNPQLREQILNYFISLVMTDSETAKLFNLPNNCRMREDAKIISPEKLIIGENVWIGENAILDASGGLEIGDNTQIGLGVYIWTHDSFKSAVMGKNTKLDKKGIMRKKTTISSNCFIGGPSVIMPGVIIEDKCVIAPMSVVYNDLSSKTIYKPFSELVSMLDEKIFINEIVNKKLKSLQGLISKGINFNSSSDEIINNQPTNKHYIATIKDLIISFIELKNSSLVSNNYKNGEIVLIGGKALVATNDYFLEVGLIEDGEKIQQFKDYAGANSLWGEYSRAKNLRMVA